MTETMLTRADFLGEWTLSRRIDDLLTEQSGVFEGMARFSPVETTGAVYEESGLLRLGDAPPMTAERRYLWDFGEEAVTVRHADGRDFFSFAPGGRGAEIVHVCDPDIYRVIHDFTAWPRWQAIWTVTGPRKDYRLRSGWRRV